jgi:hypothetical protein
MVTFNIALTMAILGKLFDALKSNGDMTNAIVFVQEPR